MSEPVQVRVSSTVIRRPPDWETVRLADGTSFLVWAEVGIVVEGFAPVVEIRLEVEDGLPVVGYLKLKRGPDGPAVTAADYRRLPFTDLVRQATMAAKMVLHLRELGDKPINDAEYVQVARQASEVGQRRVVTDRLLREVATIVAASPKGSAQAVAKQLFTSHRNAARWIAAARERGFLPPYGKES